MNSNTSLIAKSEYQDYTWQPSEVTVLIPVGGLATRAREFTKDLIPKHLIKLGNDQTVLDIILQGLQGVGFRHFIFCVGYHKEQTIRHIKRGMWVIDNKVRYLFSVEDSLLGPDGAILQAIESLAVRGQGLIVPGDALLPWLGLATMCERHIKRGADITVAVTDITTDYTTDVGRLIVETDTDRLLWCYRRTEIPPMPPLGSRALTSAAATAISLKSYETLCRTYITNNQDHELKMLSLRDYIVPWAIMTGGFEIQAYNVNGEILDLGTPSGIEYGRKNWCNFIES